MPIFEYVCSRCDEAFEAVVFRADQEVKCPKCESRKVEKQISAFAVSASSASSGSSSAGSACGSGRFT